MIGLKKHNFEQRIYSEIFKILDESISKNETVLLTDKGLPEMLEVICREIIEDFFALCEKDPASKNYHGFYFESHLSFLSIMYYRVANNVYKFQRWNMQARIGIAKKISEQGKLNTGIEIHPAARIGNRFIIDHGMGTVTRETTIIGSDCYILENVILGARGIANNPCGKRHPTIGNNVQIGGFARIFGPITIGNNVFISPHCVITDNVPDDANVSILNQLQVANNSNVTPIEIYGIFPVDFQCLKIFGVFSFHHISISIVDTNYEIIESLTADIIAKSKACICVKVSVAMDCDRDQLCDKHIKLRISYDNNTIFVTANSALRKIIASLQ